MSYPRLVSNLDSIRHNVREISKMCHGFGIELVGVVKVARGEPLLAQIYLENGVDIIGDSRIQNIKRMRQNGIKGPFMLLRIPMISEIEDVVENVDIVLVSELEVARRIGKMAASHGKRQKIIYMVDVGDLREGVWFTKAVDEIVESSKIKGIDLYGIGTNLGCYGGVIPDLDNMNLLAEIGQKIRERGVEFKVISGGNTAALYMVENKTIPQSINEYRLGESLILGTDTTNNISFKFLKQDTFTLETEIIELKTKPSVPYGKIGRDAMGRIPVFEDLGNRLKAIIAIGEQDIDPAGLIPLDKGIKVLHASSDHTVLDVSDFDGRLKLGDILKFRLTYSALLRAMTSEYVEKVW
ncbi:MAG: alanine racemase [Mesoaciditoga sp.]|uniref:alanine/ornithine racemase family PLP-dependent enzyme n=1 Tax=Athalassotoga sp. TaxID=2022597 RepID=UPI000CAE4689|nr:MAG: alanine racemase [Mesoaciditoga sp.]PMP70618.1 MAG: alanine racemase [Mesoaciditoga sp.]PMP78558.1 MAG: alanine racemase [Mesoaciditoga sp.]PMP79012.1 MAG: alanine racemase [Mesoaciditoga sp.]HEU24414.1 alanine/ornithine racemase family PLP-dependent enzyme [Mesoaciditoga lauensis]